MDLKEIKAYWNKKYPHIVISLFGDENSKFFGKMMAHADSIQLNANTLGELISQGETFLRRVKQC